MGKPRKKSQKEDETHLEDGAIPVLTKDLLDEVRKEIRDHENGVGKTYSFEEIMREDFGEDV